MVQEQLHGK
jgi:hypothetical protein